MSRAKTDQRFAPVPARAARDLRLRERHFRALTIIALHDQLDKNGAGCWASQRRLAALAGVHETALSHTLSELRDWGYLVSTMHATNRRRRIHRIVYTDHDKTWDRDTCPPQQDSRPGACAPEQVSEGRYLRKTPPILAENGVQFDASENDSKGLGLGTYVRTYKNRKNNDGDDRTDRAEARNRTAISEAEKSLATCEALAESSDRDHLKFERALLEQIAADPCLPDELNERAARLLSQL